MAENSDSEFKQVIETLKQSSVTRLISRHTPPDHPCSGGCPPHQHNHREFVIALEGSSRFRLGNGEFDLVPGCAALLDSWDIHNFAYSREDSNLLHLWGYLHHGILSVYCCRVSVYGQYRFIGRLVSMPPYIHELFTARWNSCNTLRQPEPDAEKSLLLLPLNLVLNELLLQLSSDVKESSGNDNLISAVQLYIRSKNARDCSLAVLEKISGYNRFYLAHRFKTATGLSVGSYINKVRFDFYESASARGMMKKEIASELGFSSSAALRKWLCAYAEENWKKTK